MLGRRRFVAGAVALSAAPFARRAFAAEGSVGREAFAPHAPITPIDARADRLIDVRVCTRPFRAEGPRIEVERIAGKTVVHNYGHGGSGWSLSWGSAAAALSLVDPKPGSRLAVIGCGAIGLTTALTAQRMGLRVRIYAKERPPEVRSAGATGVWSPDSRIVAEAHSTPAFERRWEAMARYSFRRYQSLLGLPGDPIEWHASYFLSDVPFSQAIDGGGESTEPDYPDLEDRLISDLHARSVALLPEQHPFPVPFARRGEQLTFNISAYARLLVDDFERAGGEIVTHTFDSPRQFRSLHEPVIVNATGFGARALLGDESIVPVRGQTARLVPQPDVHYNLYYRGHNLAVVGRRDGILVQAQAEDDFGNDRIEPDRAMSEAAVARLATLFPRTT